MIFKKITKEAFSNHLSQVKEASFMQTPEMATLLKKRGFQTEFVALLSDDDTVLVSAILYSLPMTGGLHMEINSGPISTKKSYLSSFYKELKNYAKQKGAIQLIVKPYDTYQTFDSNGKPTSEEASHLIRDLTDIGYRFDGLKKDYPGGEPDWHYVKDLTGISQDNLLKSYSKKGRPLVKKAGKFGTKIRKLERNELHIFKEITSSTSNRRQYTDKSLDYYEDFYDSFGDKAEFLLATLNFQDYTDHLQTEQNQLKEKIKVLENDLQKNPNSCKKQNKLRELNDQFDTFTTRISEASSFIKKYGDNDIPLAASLFVYSQKEAVYLFSGSYTEFNKFYAPALLQDYAMREIIKREILFYTFLGITGHFDGSDGVLRFKQNFNGFIVRKMGTFRYYPKPLKFKMITLIKKLLRRH